jgi:hypothetical protein
LKAIIIIYNDAPAYHPIPNPIYNIFGRLIDIYIYMTESKRRSPILLPV